jgi:hypothetical protein
MILCGYPASEKQTEHHYAQNALVSVIAMFQRHTFSPSAIELICSTCRILERFDELIVSMMAILTPRLPLSLQRGSLSSLDLGSSLLCKVIVWDFLVPAGDAYRKVSLGLDP